MKVRSSRTARAGKERNTSTVIETFRSNPENDYRPDEEGSVEDITKQSRGDTRDERSLHDVRKHDHDGANSVPVKLKNLAGMLRTVSAAPTWAPTCLFEQVVVYRNGATLRLYVYDVTNKAWRYATLT